VCLVLASQRENQKQIENMTLPRALNIFVGKLKAGHNAKKKEERRKKI